jgi:hypothetical protein
MARPGHGYPFHIRAPALPSVLSMEQRSRLARAPDGLSIDAAEYLEILAEAVDRRNGWKVILERCSPKKT